MKSTQTPYRILSLDGGGIRGLYTAVLLHGIAQRVARINKTNEHDLDIGGSFDMIVGTSTGAILAVALAAGVSLEDIIKLYNEKSSKIFHNPIPMDNKKLKAFAWLWKNRSKAANDSSGLYWALSEVFGNETLEEMYTRRNIALCIPTVNIETNRSWVFKTPHGSRLQRDNHYKLIDICMSSAAAPIVFPIHGVKVPNSTSTYTNWFVDGGIWANNPILVGITEALEFAPKDKKIEILSISTSPPFKAPLIDKDCVNRGILDWRGGMRIIEAAIDAQSEAYGHIAKTLAKHLDDRISYVRLADPKVNDEKAKYLGLDNASEEARNILNSLAFEAIDLNMSKATKGEDNMGLILDIFSTTKSLKNNVASAIFTDKP